MTHIVNISGGMASAVCLFRVIERFGRDDVLAVFADTRSEHADCYRFIDDVERVAGVKVERLSDGRDCWDVWMGEAMLTTPGNGGCVASDRLKRQPLDEFRERLASPEDSTIYVGFGPDEADRKERLVAALAPWAIACPLMWSPRLWRCDLAKDLRARGIEPPSMYAEGYPHANCAGACILAGIKQWAGLLTDNPTLYARYEQKEAEFGAMLASRGRAPRTILRDRRGGQTRNLSLTQLREELAQGIRDHDDSWRSSSCSCMALVYRQSELPFMETT